MNLHSVPSGVAPPDDFNVVIEIAMNSDPVKYEIDEKTGAFFVDRFMSTAMHYPCNYGHIPDTIAGDGDPVDVLVVAQFPLPTGVVVRCRPVGLLVMQDEGGNDAKVLAVPIDKLTLFYQAIRQVNDFPKIMLDQIRHFFEHYKDLEPGKYVRVGDWLGPDAAREEIIKGIQRYDDAEHKPAF